jgi:DNA processing protein
VQRDKVYPVIDLTSNHARLDANRRSIYGVAVTTAAAHHARVLALAENLSPHLNGPTAARFAEQLDEVGIEGTLAGERCWAEIDSDWLEQGLERITAESIDRWMRELDNLKTRGIALVTVADIEYPRNLRTITNRPPLLFIEGAIIDADERAMAVVGTRKPSAEGLAAATALACELSQRGVTVISGLAHGVDAAAHAAALNCHGRTLAVFGTGIGSVYPAANRGLARQIVRNGACISQFWPSQSGAPWTFPVRNIITSGLSLGTAVIEAGETSGARLQAQEALRHGKRLFLLEKLVTKMPWAQAMIGRPGVTIVSSVEQIIEAIEFDLNTRTVEYAL